MPVYQQQSPNSNIDHSVGIFHMRFDDEEWKGVHVQSDLHTRQWHQK